VFQCSSASRKFLNRSTAGASCALLESFSALQRAENSSIGTCTRCARCRSRVSVLFSEPKIPQSEIPSISPMRPAVSVLFSEPKIPQCAVDRGRRRRSRRVSVLFSEPKIPQCQGSCAPPCPGRVSVLFSEPKIPQSRSGEAAVIGVDCFSALQRAENSSIDRADNG